MIIVYTMETLEQLLNKSARLLLWHEKNKNDEGFQKYFNNHFRSVRSLGYVVCLNEINPTSVEVYFRVTGNCDYRSKGVVVGYN